MLICPLCWKFERIVLFCFFELSGYLWSNEVLKFFSCPHLIKICFLPF